MNIENGSRVRGARVIIAECGTLPGGNAASETFTWNAATGEIKVFDGTPDVKCIAIAGGSLTSGQAIVTWDCHGGPDEKWEPGADGRSIVLRGTSICLDVPGGNSTPGTGINTFSCGGNINQSWDARVSGPPPAPPPDLRPAYGTGDFVQLLSGAATDRCMNVENGSTAAGSRVIIAPCGPLPNGNTPSETFRWYSNTGEIKVYDGTPDVKCVAVSNGVQSGQPLVTAACTGAAEQQWQPGVDWTSIVLRSASICIDLPGGNATPGTGLLSFGCGGNINQKWTARVVPPPDVAQEHAAPVLGTPAHNGDNRNLALCGATCFELAASYSTPAYVSLDQPRSVTMVYLGRQAVKSALVQVDAEDRSTTPPDTMSLRLRRPDNSWVTFPNGTTEVFFRAGSGMNRLAVRVDDPSFTTGAYFLTAVVTSRWNGTPGVTRTTERPVRVLVVNQDASPYGWGWSIAGIHRIRLTGGTASDSIVAWDGTGTVQYFKNSGCDGTGACTYDPPDGEFSTIKYDPNGAAFSQPFARFWPDGSIVGYDANGRERFSRDRFGNETRVEWVDGERIASIADPANKVTNFAYENGKLRTITDPGGRVTTVTIDANGDVESIVDPGLRTIFRGTYQGHVLSASLDARGSQTDYGTDQLARVRTVTLPTITVNGAPTRPQTTVVNAEASAAVDFAAGKGTPTNPSPRVDPDTLRTLVTNARGFTTGFQLDRFGAPVRIEEPLGRTTEITRDEHSRPRTVREPSGHTTTIDYELWRVSSRVIRATDETTGRVVNISYGTNRFDLPARVYGDVPERNYVYRDTAEGRWVLDSTWVTGQKATHYTFDARGRVVSVTDPEGHPTTITYAPDGWQNTQFVVAGTNPRQTTYTPNSYGLTSWVTTADGYTEQTEYDVLNRVRRTVDKMSRATVYNYDDPLFLTSVVDAKQQRYAFQPNALGWVEVETDPRQLQTRYGYDAGGNLTSVVNRRQQTITFTYDELDQLSARTADGATTTYRVDPTGRWVVAANAESVDTTYFDVAGRASSAVTVRPGGARHVLVYTTDVRNRLTALTSASWSVGYQYSARDVLDTLIDAAGLRTVLTHNFDDQPVETGLPMGVRVLTNYPSTHAQSGLTYNFPLLDDSLGVGYVRDSLARIITRLNNQGNRGRDYLYDPVGRLKATKDFTIDDPGGICTPIYKNDQPAPDEEPIGFTCPDTVGRRDVDSTTFTYDQVGNRTDNGAVIEVGNRLTRVGRWVLEYDADGNLTRKYDPSCPSTCDRRFWWSSVGLLDSAFTSESGTVRYGYDGLGRRIRRTPSSGGAQFYVYDGDNLWRETDAGGAVVREYSYYPGVDAPHAVRMNGQLYYFQQDGFGNVTGLIRSDGSLERKVSYDPFGSLAAGSSPVLDFGFKGREHDAATGLVYMRARWYDPELGRFISEDPAGLEADVNRYVFARNDPINLSDPFGLDPCSTDALAEGWKTVEVDGKPWCYNPGIAQLPPIRIEAQGDPFFETLWFRATHGGLFTPPDAIIAGVPSWMAGPEGAGENLVYRAVRNGKTVYVGITKNFAARAAAHLRLKGIQITQIPGLSGLSRFDARAVEQVLINRYKLVNDGGTLINKINSIARSNEIYDEAIARGLSILQKLKF